MKNYDNHKPQYPQSREAENKVRRDMGREEIQGNETDNLEKITRESEVKVRKEGPSMMSKAYSNCLNVYDACVETSWALVPWVSLSAAVGTIGVLAYVGIIKPLTEVSDFNTVYQEALFKYADKNKDGFVSAVENDAFDKDLLKGKGVTLVTDNWPKYKDGSSVPTKLVVKWIKEYKPSE